MIQNNRLIILGSGGFISGNVEKKLNETNITILKIPRKKIDLKKHSSIQKLLNIIKKGDAIFFAAAEAPVKNENMLLNNLLMAKNVCEVIKKKLPSFLLYLSSDAVYSDKNKKIDENSLTIPNSLHGTMHLIREIMLENVCNKNLCIVRPTLVYGEGDPHNGYGPNRFIKLIKKKKPIELFGRGEELRDHVWIDDVSEAISKLIISRKVGKYNIVTGKVISFNEISKKLTNFFGLKNKIIYKKRNGPMPHNGYRAFKKSALSKIYPSFKFKSFDEVLNNFLK